MRKVQFHACTLIVVLALFSVGAKYGRQVASSGPPKTDFAVIPMNLNGWMGHPGEFHEDTQKQLPSASLFLRYFQHEDYPVTDLAIVYGTDLGDFHQPEICLEGQGMRTLSKARVSIDQGDGNTVDAIGLIMDSSYGRRAFIYWFTAEGVTSTSLGNYQFRIFYDRLTGRRVVPSAMIRISTQVLYSDDEAIEQLVKFAEDFAPYLQEQFSAEQAME